MAHSLGYEQQRDQAAYYSLMQLPGLLSCATPESMVWLRKQRPWLLHHSCSTDINWLERTRPNHHLEFNERIGLFHYIIHPRTAVYSHGVIMTRLPEIMRPFRELWPEFIREHIFFKVGGDYFSRHAPPPLDSFVYLLHQPPFPVEELFQLRQDMKLNAYEKIADWRALLDSRGHLQYRKLW